MEKMVSGFAITGRAKGKSDLPGADPMVDPRMEQVMSEMEREFSSMGDTENPDPRMLARMMRRMTELGGEKVPPVMQEMIARLERGEDPEKLEAEFGDVMDGFDAAMGDSPEEQALAATLRKRRNPVTRDPKLYEMSEFCD
jgi:hypothetical protein